ncbi:hypothetical protein MPOCJGCO_3100 [Methylobacterium trifolii]|uniref:N-acetyltransferase domain-containing protein n=2 Tax=Methylobacterium trifolii TaxID=1003092 RepID=A0ABQ4U2K5_9HYPH|nr:hypothetical protein MPOCJGCO_3100 [Methylobacterium trifolii]
MRYAIERYFGGRDGEVADLVLSIQNGEAGLTLTVDEQPDLLDIKASYDRGGFWVATLDGKIVGTIGLLRYAKRGALKKFFVAKDHKGGGI